MIATVAFAGIEAAANLAPDLEVGPADLRKLRRRRGDAGAADLLRRRGRRADGGARGADARRRRRPRSAATYIENPVLGVVQSFDPPWIASLMEIAVVAIVPVALIWAANTAMLGLSRHVYVLATNRQIPSWLGKLNRRFQTPHVAIVIAAVIAFVLVAPTDVELLGGLFAFGATIAFTIAHVSIIRLRITEPERAAAVPDPVRRPSSGGRAAAAAGDRRRGADGAGLGQRRRLPRQPRSGSAAAGCCSGSSPT